MKVDTLCNRLVSRGEVTVLRSPKPFRATPTTEVEPAERSQTARVNQRETRNTQHKWLVHTKVTALPHIYQTWRTEEKKRQQNKEIRRSE